MSDPYESSFYDQYVSLRRFKRLQAGEPEAFDETLKSAVDVLPFVREVERLVKTVYGPLEIGDCWKINETVLYFLHNECGEATTCLQGRVSVAEPVKDIRNDHTILTRYPSHVFGYANGSLVDFARGVFNTPSGKTPEVLGYRVSLNNPFLSYRCHSQDLYAGLKEALENINSS